MNYYTPSLEDLSYGYEYEILLPCGEWEKAVIAAGNLIGSRSFKDMVEDGNIRVPYLTQEQILNEGWALDTKHKQTDTINLYVKGIYWLIIHLEQDIPFLKLIVNDFKSQDERMISEIIYCCNCTDINKFRYLMKIVG